MQEPSLLDHLAMERARRDLARAVDRASVYDASDKPPSDVHQQVRDALLRVCGARLRALVGPGEDPRLVVDRVVAVLREGVGTAELHRLAGAMDPWRR